MEREDILVLDLETDDLDLKKAKLKWFGAYSYLDNKFYLLKYTEVEKIKDLISRHSVFVGFNQIEYDVPILKSNKFTFNYKNQVDLLEVSRKRLPSMGIRTPNYKLKTICETLKLDEFGKGDIDYNIFKKDKWSKEEEIQIKKWNVKIF